MPTRTQERSQDYAATDAQSLKLRASPPQKKFTRLCSSSISGIMGNHNTYLAPSFTPNDFVPAPVNVVVLWGLLAPLPVGRPHHLYQMSSQKGNCLSPCGLRTPQTSPLMTLFQHQRMWLFSRVCWDWMATQPLPNVLPEELPLPLWPEEPQTSLCSWGFTLPTRAPPGIELRSFRLCAPPVYSLNGI